MISSELEIRTHIRISRGELLGAPISHDCATDLARFEPGIAQIEIERGGRLAGLNQFLVSGRGVGELRFVIELVGGLESRNGILGVDFGSADEQEEGWD